MRARVGITAAAVVLVVWFGGPVVHGPVGPPAAPGDARVDVLHMRAAAEATRFASAPRPSRRPVRATRSRVATARVYVGTPSDSETQASWYGETPYGCYDSRGFHRFPSGLTRWTANRTLPCGTMVRIVDVANGRTITVPVWDRGPYGPGRDFDLSRAAFAELAPLSCGVIRVRWSLA